MFELTLIYFGVCLLACLGIILFYFGAFITRTLAGIALTILYEDAFGDE